jgi:phenylalanyl-tRNA synthetase beta chain
MLGILGTGGFFDPSWQNADPAYTFYHLKGLAEGLLQRLRIRDYVIEPQSNVPWLAPEDAACIRIGGEIAGVMGTLSPALMEKYKLRQPVRLAEIDLEKIAPCAFAPVRYEPLPKLPSAERDLSVVVDKNIVFQTIRVGIYGLGIAELTDIRLIDVYEGEKIPEEKISLTLRLTFLDREKALTIERIQELMNAVQTFLKASYGAKLR